MRKTPFPIQLTRALDQAVYMLPILARLNKIYEKRELPLILGNLDRYLVDISGDINRINKALEKGSRAFIIDHASNGILSILASVWCYASGF